MNGSNPASISKQLDRREKVSEKENGALADLKRHEIEGLEENCQKQEGVGQEKERLKGLEKQTDTLSDLKHRDGRNGSDCINIGYDQKTDREAQMDERSGRSRDRLGHSRIGSTTTSSKSNDSESRNARPQGEYSSEETKRRGAERRELSERHNSDSEASCGSSNSHRSSSVSRERSHSTQRHSSTRSRSVSFDRHRSNRTFTRRRSRSRSYDRHRSRNRSYDRRLDRSRNYDKRRSHGRSYDRRRSRSRSYDRRRSRSRSYDRHGKYRGFVRRRSRSRSFDRRRSSSRNLDRRFDRRRNPDRGRTRSRSYSTQSRSGSNRSGRSARSTSIEKSSEETAVSRDLLALTRDSRTVVVTQLQMKVRESDVKHFFSQSCRVRKVRLVCDSHTGRSKGIAYVELSALGDRDQALKLSGTPFIFKDGRKGFPCIVKPSEAERNFIAANVAKQAAQSTSGRSTVGQTSSSKQIARLIVSNLHATIDEKELKSLCEHFGTVEGLDLKIDSRTKQSKGIATIVFSDASEAANARESLNGKVVGGEKLSVSWDKYGADEEVHRTGSARDNVAWNLDLDERGQAKGGVRMDYEQRASIMSKLAGGAASDMVAANKVSNSSVKPTCIRISNMFDPKLETEDGWEEDIRADALEECEKYGSVLFCQVDAKSDSGNVFVKFSSPEASEKATIAIHNRVFDGRPLQVTSLWDEEMKGHIERSKV